MRRAAPRVALALSLGLAAAPAPATAQEAADTVETQALRAAAQAYIDSDAQQRLIDNLLSARAISAQLRAANPDLPPRLGETISRIAADELAALRPEFEAAMVAAAVDTFTLAEIGALHRFYNTPEGEAILLKMQPFLERSLDMVAADIRAAQERILERARAELRAGD